MPRNSSRRRLVAEPFRAYVESLKSMFRRLVDGFEKHTVTTVEQDKFVIAFKDAFALIDSKNDFNEVMNIYHVASRFIPSLHTHAGAVFYRLGLVEEAMACFQCGVDAVPDDLSAVSQLENACCALVERWHFGMLNDANRNASYREAILSAVSLGHRDVLDIGTGTGLLACFSAKSGAKSIFACDDSTTMCAIASAVFSKNNISTVKLLKMRSTDIEVPRDLPQRVSLVVTEIFDAALFGEFVLKTLQHAWRELLHPPKPSNIVNGKDSSFGLVVPAMATVFVCAIQSCDIRNENRLVSSSYRHLSLPADIDFRVFCYTNFRDQSSRSRDDVCEPPSDNAENSDDGIYESYTTERISGLRNGYSELSDEKVLLNVNFNDPAQIDALIKEEFHVEFEIKIKKAGILDAIVMWFNLDMSNDKTKRTITSRPNNSINIAWEQAVFPVLPCHMKAKGDQSLFVGLGDVLHLKATLEDGSRLQIRCINITRKNGFGSPAPVIERPLLTLTMSRPAVRYLNDTEYNFSMSRILEYAHHHDGCQSVLIMSSVPSFLALQAAIIGFQRVVQLVPRSCDTLPLSLFASKMQALEAAKTGDKPVVLPQFVSGPIEQLAGQQGFDIIMSELVEPEGTLRQQSIEELQLAKLIFGNCSTIFCPARLRIYGTFIESDELFERAVVLKGNNDGYECASSCRCSRSSQVHVADFINLYRVRSHIDIDMHALNYRSLSEKLLIFDIDLAEEQMNKNLDKDKQPAWLKSVTERQVNVTATGRLAALLYWFEIELVDGSVAQRYIANEDKFNIDRNIFTVSTCRASSHFRQSAILIAEDRPMSVISGYILNTRFVFHNSCLTFSFLSGVGH